MCIIACLWVINAENKKMFFRLPLESELPYNFNYYLLIIRMLFNLFPINVTEF